MFESLKEFLAPVDVKVVLLRELLFVHALEVLVADWVGLKSVPINGLGKLAGLEEMRLCQGLPGGEKGPVSFPLHFPVSGIGVELGVVLLCDVNHDVLQI